MPIEQKTRLLTIDAPFIKKGLLLSVQGNEGFSQLYQYQCDFVELDRNLTADKVIGKPVQMCFKNTDEEIMRYASGIVSQFQTLERLHYYEQEHDFLLRRYQITVVPTLFYLTQSSHCRVFQNQSGNYSTSDIIETILKDYAIDYQLDIKTPYKVNYSMQYNESDYDYLQRLMQVSGLYFYFTFDKKKSTLNIADNNKKLQDYQLLSMSFIDNSAISNNLITHFSTTSSLVPSKIASTDVNVEQFSQDLYSTVDVSAKSTETSQAVQFQFPAAVTTSAQVKTSLTATATNYELQLEQGKLNTNYVLSLGQTIKLEGDYFSEFPYKKLVMTQIEFLIYDKRELKIADFGDKLFSYHCQANTMNTQAIWKDQVIYKKPYPGLQYATVVAKSGKNSANPAVYYDSLGRVCIQFQWEKYPDNKIKSNQFDQCMVNSINQWDNGIYRIGTVVMVDFINHDPDKPIIIGSVNTNEDLVLGQYTEENAYQSVLQRYPGSDKAEFNSLLFDDKDKKQMVTLTAIKDLSIISVNEAVQAEKSETQVKETYSLKAKSCTIEASDKYSLKTKASAIEASDKYSLKTKTCEIKADSIVLKGNVKLDGNLTISGDVSITGKTTVK